MNDPARRCKNCRFFFPVGNQGQGQCWHSPRARIQSGAIVARYPVAQGYEWCGNHEAKTLADMPNPADPPPRDHKWRD